MHNVTVAGRSIGQDFPPFIVAEMSGNHNHSLERALDIVRSAAAAGVHAVKLQTYTPDTMTLDIDEGEFRICDPSSPWDGRTLFGLYQDAYTPWEWHRPIFDLCDRLGLVAFSTPFDVSAVDFLESLNVPCYKIASFENTDLPLIERVSSTGKPVIISTGLASLCELEEMVTTARNAGCKDLILLKCTSTYPAHPQDSNLRTLPHLQEMFNCVVGFSDHTLGVGTAAAAVTLGASVIEKHFTLHRADGGVDAAFSMEPAEMRSLVDETTSAWEALGHVHYGATQTEKPSLMHRRSLYFTRTMSPGDIIQPDDIKSIRPGLGLPPKYGSVVIGRTVDVAVRRGTPVQWNVLR